MLIPTPAYPAYENIVNILGGNVVSYGLNDDFSINIENLKYRYPDTKELALDGITCDIKPGEFIGVIGRNGSGKIL